MTSTLRFLRATPAVVLATVLSLSCADPAQRTAFPTAPNLGKVTSGPTVSAATPPYGRQAQTGEQVTITGSGFATDAVVMWVRNADGDTTKVKVRNTQVVSSTQIVATIDIAPDADLAFYDVTVTNGDRKKGIGTDLFEVTTALSLGSLGSNTNANAASDNGQAVGYSVVSSGQQHAFYWDATVGMIDIGGHNALGIDRAGTTIVGDSGGFAVVWIGSGSTWTSARLPLSAGATGGNANTVASDPVTGVAAIIGGSETITVGRSTLQRPRLWRWTGTSWRRDTLPMPFANMSGTYSWVTAVNANGQATGTVRVGAGNPQAVFWEADGSYTLLGDGGTIGINAAGTAIASFVYGTGGGPRYYWRSSVGTSWSGPVPLPGGCYDATGMDDAGYIIVRRCPVPGSSRTTSGVFAPPTSGTYTSLPTLLAGLGDLTDGGTAWGISRNGTYIAGTAPTKPSRVGVRWRNPLVP